ncbi:MAG: hypothetical protein DRG78_03215 [Epsilonproteobacteria bacterium]|nr:MAG: hypothetical protein DRG78_03215 [Campylobacterota bacterium]
MITLLLLLIIFISLEIFESNWQKANDFYGVIKNNYQIYNKNIFLFFILNPTFIFAIYLAIIFNNYGFLMNTIIVLKFVDISFRLNLCRKIDNNEDISSFVPYNMEYNNILRYINVILYPGTFILSIL